MADQKISELNQAILPLDGSEQLAVVQGGETRRVSPLEADGIPAAQVPGYYAAPLGRKSGVLSDGPANTAVFIPVYIAHPMTFDEVIVHGGRDLVSGDRLALAIYGCSKEILLPMGGPIWESGELVNEVDNLRLTISASPPIALKRGTYFFAYNSNNGGRLLESSDLTSFAALSGPRFATSPGTWASGSTSILKGFMLSQTFGTWPTRTGAASEASDYVNIGNHILNPFIFLRMA